ncbi:unnamed protein product [Cuscuta campestris]|uniref:PsbP C-terminal domain-containing protein n=1 Tax=Cuscuta campestris TaxID=132261 RepID=A0A484L3N7_9ASTE|nr:unnamed protein product [Cuscuta campestris]
MSTLLSLAPNPLTPIANSISEPIVSPKPNSLSRRFLFFTSSVSLSSFLYLPLQHPLPVSSAEAPPPPQSSSSSSNSFLSGIANTKSWFQLFGDGFSIRIPPHFEDTIESEKVNAGLLLYGDKAKPKTFAARYASPDGSEVVSVVIRPANQLKITFLEAQDIGDLGSLKQVAKIFVPGGATLYSAHSIKIREDEGYRTYYFYEYGQDERHIALVAAVNGGKAFIVGATAPEDRWNDDGIKLRSAAVSFTVL